MRVEKADPVELPPNAEVRLTEMGNVTEIMFSETRSTGGHIQKVSADQYIDLKTGELKDFKKIENRSQDLNNVAKSLKKLRDILNTNITDVSFCRWVTLTYADNMTDPVKLRYDAENCIKRLRAKFGHFEYITVAEPQARGAWHLHCVFIFPGKAPYMANDIVADCWKKGFVVVKRLDDVDNVGAYLTAYLGDMELSEVEKLDRPFSCNGFKEVEYTDETGKKQSKKFVKGARLCLYPPKFNIYRKSRGIKDPVVTVLPYYEAMKKAGSAKPTFSRTVRLSDDDTAFSNLLHYEYYNKLR